MTNIYYGASDFGYELLAELDDEQSRDDYGFDILAVWRRLSDGALFWGQDSGCSCPSPFEDYTDPSGSTWIQPIVKTRAEFEAVLRDFRANPADKQRFWILGRKPFGATVLVNGSTAVRV